MMKKIILSVFGTLALIGCNSNPYPEDGQITTVRPPLQREVEPAFALYLPDAMEFTEGKESSYLISAKIPSGTPRVEAFGLPPGAKFDDQTMTLTWTPDFDSGSATSLTTGKTDYKSYVVKFRLYSNEGSVQAIERSATLLVKDAPRDLIITPSETLSHLTEGTPFEMTVKVSNADFPQGPFTLKVEGLPGGATVESLGSAGDEFTLKYTPSFADVTIKSYDGYGINRDLIKNYKVNLVATSPNGKIDSIVVTWEVTDQRKAPQITAPTQIEQGPDVSFIVSAENLNLENSPAIKLDPIPVIGRVNLEAVNSSTLASQVSSVFVRWTDIPADKYGTIQVLTFKACIEKHQYDTNKSMCVNQKINVLLTGSPHSVPEIDRTAWPLGSTRYLKSGNSLQVSLPVRAAGLIEPEPRVVIEPATQDIQWKNGVLTINSTTLGLKQFNVIAQSAYGLTVKESFNIEVVPASWSSTVILADGLHSAETRSILDFYPDAQVVNPSIQYLDEHILALRSLLVISTEALRLANTPEQMAAIERAAMLVKNVVVLSPLAGTFQGVLQNEFGQLGIQWRGRFHEMTTLPALQSFNLLPMGGSGLSASQKSITLKGGLTSESYSPLFMSLNTQSNCRSLLALNHPKLAADFMVASSCKRSNGGTLLVSGVEWGDFSLGSVDALLTKQWMKQLVKP